MEEKEFLESYHKCARCSKKYLMIDNIGKYNCLQHTGYITVNGVFSCCGVYANGARDAKDYYNTKRPIGTSNELGCNPCSHVSKYKEKDCYIYNEKNGYVIYPKALIDLYSSQFNPDEPIITENKDLNKVYVFIKLFETPPASPHKSII
jgi:hypothetical protein